MTLVALPFPHSEVLGLPSSVTNNVEININEPSSNLQLQLPEAYCNRKLCYLNIKNFENTSREAEWLMVNG